MSIDVQSNAKRIRALENRTYIPYSRLADEAKKLKMNGSMLTIDGNGDLNFTKNMLCKNVTADNNIKIEKNADDISNIKDEIAVLKDTKADVGHTHTDYENRITNLEHFRRYGIDEQALRKIRNLTIEEIIEGEIASEIVQHFNIRIDAEDLAIGGEDDYKYVSKEGHTHTISEIENLNDTLDNKADKGNLLTYYKHIDFLFITISGLFYDSSYDGEYYYRSIITHKAQPILKIGDDVITPTDAYIAQADETGAVWTLKFNANDVHIKFYDNR